MERFISKFKSKIIGVLRCFDRVMIRGTLMPLRSIGGMTSFLTVLGIPQARWGEYLEETTRRVREATLAVAAHFGRPTVNLRSSELRKEEVVRQLATRDNITKGYICALTCQERSTTFKLSGGVRKPLHLIEHKPPALHVYHYLQHPRFGLMHIRLQTWAPFSVQVCLNGHEFLARALDREGIRYRKNDNCFPWIEDFGKAQSLADRFAEVDWHRILLGFVREYDPVLSDILGSYRAHYYWSALQTEYSTDISFASTKDLAAIYPALVHHAITSFGSKDVLRFLGRKPESASQREVTTRFQNAPEGIRVRHSVDHNSVKIYDKNDPRPAPVAEDAPAVLRVESTINQAKDFTVLRPPVGKPRAKKTRRPLPQTVEELPRRAAVSQGINDRYLDALASTETDIAMGTLVEKLAGSVRGKGKRPFRPIRLWHPSELRLFAAVNRGEFVLQGFRTRDIKGILFDTPAGSPQDERRRTAYVSRLIRLLRAHRLVVKLPRSRRYTVTRLGRDVFTTVLAIQVMSPKEITKRTA